MRFLLLLAMLTACDAPAPVRQSGWAVVEGYDGLSRGEVARYQLAGPAPQLGALTVSAPAQDSAIARTAAVTVETDSVGPIAVAIRHEVGRIGGRISASSEEELARARLTAHVPGDSLPVFLERVRAISPFAAVFESSESVSGQVLDLDARLRNARRLEDRLLRLLESRPGDLEDVLAAERELARVRTEIEIAEAHRREFARRIREASVDFTIVLPRKTAPPWTATIGVEFLDGFVAALRAGVRVLGFLLPTALLAAVAVVAWRRWRPRTAPSGAA